MWILLDPVKNFCFPPRESIPTDFSEEEKLLLSAAYGIDGSRTRSLQEWCQWCHNCCHHWHHSYVPENSCHPTWYNSLKRYPLPQIPDPVRNKNLYLNRFPNPGTKLLRITNISEKSNHRIFGLWFQIVRRDQPLLCTSVCICYIHPVSFYDKSGLIRTGIFTMDQRIGNHFTGNDLPETFSLIPLQKKTCPAKCLRPNSINCTITFDQIGLNHHGHHICQHSLSATTHQS